MILEKVAKYQIWANDIMRGIMDSLTEEEFESKDIKDLTIHTILAIEYNLEAIINNKDVDYGEMYEDYYRLTKEDIMKKWTETDNQLLNQIMKMGSEKIEFPNFVTGEGVVIMTQEDYYCQYLTHTIYHRGQLMTKLKKLGKEGKTTDYLIYLLTEHVS